MRFILTLALMLACVAASAQSDIIGDLQTRRPGDGAVTVHQDATVAALIGKRYVRPETEGAGQNVLKTRGYRVQVYVGNNSRVARNEANEVAEKVKTEFPDLPVYTYFQPPRWLCRVGDYKSMEEAYDAMRKLKASGKFKEVAIVKENINIVME